MPVWSLEELMRHCREIAAEINGRYVPARPLYAGFRGARIRAAWMVLRGKADAFTWPEGQ